MDNEVSLSFNNKSCNANDEQPINVERLPPQPITKKPGGHYAIPPKRAGYDGVVELPKSSNDHPANGRNKVEAPRAVHPNTPPPDSRHSHGDDDAPIYGNVDVYDNDVNGPQETYDVPPKHEDDEETYSAPPVSRRGYEDTQPQETYDVPPLSNGIPDGPEETYDVPPKHEDEPQETYDVPPKSQEYPDEPQETYDVPPVSMTRPLIGNNDDEQETYDVPPKQDSDDEIYENSLQVKPKTGHYSVPQSPFLKRRNENNGTGHLSPPSRSARHSYENVDFDGNQLLTS